MNSAIERVVIVGGGTAGWLAACRLASARRSAKIEVTLIEAPDIPTIGVGEGTWPTMRATLSAIGIGEAEFLAACDGSFKQGSRFDRWVTGAEGDSYLHPFTSPPAAPVAELLAAWQAGAPDLPFAAAMTAQAHVCDLHLAPRQRAMPDYQGAANYAYHLDAGKFAALLAAHAVQRLGVRHISDHVVDVARDDDGGIASVATRQNGDIAGDLFIDCSGHAALLIGGHLGVEWIDRGDTLFNDRALAAQVPVAAGSPIASQTVSTAHAAGWIWDIGLPGRRGVGCVYSSRFMTDDAAEATLRAYIARVLPDAPAVPARRLSFPTGHRARFWEGNCIAVGLSAGFIEPLEASAIVMIELSLNALIDNFPVRRGAMPIHAERFNELFCYRWDRIVEFLKLHYALSRREEPYWLAQRDPAHMPPSLSAMLELWRDQPPSLWDFPRVDEIFSAESHQYILYGMGYPVPPGVPMSERAVALLAENRQRARALVAALPANRDYLDALATSAHNAAVR
ncbi:MULTISPECIES: tryptophan halogenase family protein [unclassified Sphingopyxis]|uniref:tryptophan halogenase family protein n=1 Tax=unclassified Sphingopyxis TaxID=2614943 RepID=UPI0006C5A700|nr:MULTISPECIES: tryptophan halogenase family protein [unclassified Sphingopyxis]USI78416.1 tryptophan 7-halogenase [Sphingopyxis sp. USTB-05]GAO79180.1 tryptophan halogenase, putative [Sphingopyxis sp. C-1]